MFLKIDKLKEDGYEKYIKLSDINAVKVGYFDGYRVIISCSSNSYVWKQWPRGKDEAEEVKYLVEAEREASNLIIKISGGAIITSKDLE